jgi:hypothetical protein
LINNRQNGRRRGRGGQRPGGGGNPGQPNGNRIDNRARGNANQLYEKYKALAADSQRQGDRVTTEYYLQFADHYFRVLSESRPRFEEQRRRDEFDEDGEGESEEFGMEGDPVRADQYQGRRDDRQRDDRPRQDREARDNRQDREQRAEGDRPERGERHDRGERQERPRDDRRPRNGYREAGEANGHAVEAVATTQPDPETAEASAPHMADMEASAPRRRGRPRRERTEEAPVAETFEADRLPPSLSVSASAEPDTAAPEGEAERPRRRRRAAPVPEATPAS